MGGMVLRNCISRFEYDNCIARLNKQMPSDILLGGWKADCANWLRKEQHSPHLLSIMS